MLREEGYSAGSFRDLTRVARLDEKMWTDLFLRNADFLVDEIERSSSISSNTAMFCTIAMHKPLNFCSKMVE